MKIVHRRLAISFIINIIIIILGISAFIVEIIKKNFFGVFRYFTIDGNLLSIIFSLIILTRQYMALKISATENPKNLIISHILYIIGLISASTELVIFIVVILILMPMAGKNCLRLINTYNGSCFHVINPILLNFRFIFLDTRERDLLFYEKGFGGIPMVVYGLTMLILVLTKVFTGYGLEGDGKIPYPFLDVYHRSFFLCFSSIIFIVCFGFGIGFFLDYINKKCERLIYPYVFKVDNEEVNQVMELV